MDVDVCPWDSTDFSRPLERRDKVSKSSTAMNKLEKDHYPRKLSKAITP